MACKIKIKEALTNKVEEMTNEGLTMTLEAAEKLASDVNNQFKDDVVKFSEIDTEIKRDVTISEELVNVYYQNEREIENSKLRPNEVNKSLKSIDILSSDKAKQIFEKGKKANWDLNKILTELQVPKEQKQLIIDSYNKLIFSGKNENGEDILIEPTVEELILDLLSNYSYAIEINTATRNRNSSMESSYENYGNTSRPISEDDMFNYYEQYGMYFREDKVSGTEIEISKAEYESGINPKKTENTDYYSNLTVPGGINYTENEISTPAITPSIKGHAEFATDNGIGWFRSDEEGYNNDYSTNVNSDKNNEFVYENDLYKIEENEQDFNPFGGSTPFIDIVYSKNGIEISQSEYIKAKQKFVNISKDYKLNTKTRRILEVQSDWGQKQRKSSKPDINIKYDIQQIINDLQKSGDLKIDCN